MQRELAGPADRAGARAGEAAGRSLRRNFETKSRHGQASANGWPVSLRDQIATAGKPLLIALGTALSTTCSGR